MTMRDKRTLSRTAFTGYGIELRPVSPLDLLSLRRWRNTPKINQQMVDKSYITSERQRRWFESISHRDDQAHWVVWFRGVRTGYVNIRSDQGFEKLRPVSGGYYVADTKVRQPLLGLSTLLMYHDVIFNYLQAVEIQDTVMKTNFSVRNLNALMGYHELEETDDFIRITLYLEDYQKARIKYMRYFDNPQCLPIFS